MMKLFLKSAFAVGCAAFAMQVYAVQGMGGKGMDASGIKMDCMKNLDGVKDMNRMQRNCMGSGAAQVSSMSYGEVKRVDRVNENITLKHGPIKSATIEMGPMTMPFHVKDPSLLSKVKVGDKVKFTVENVNDVATVTSLAIQK